MPGMALALAAAPMSMPAPAFRPPLGTVLRYRVAEDFVGPETQRLVRRYALRFEREDGGYVATLTLVSQEVEGLARVRAGLGRMFAPLVGMPVRVRLDGEGHPGVTLDSDAAWTAFVASRRTVAANLDASAKTLPPAVLAASRAALAREIDPARRDERLREPLAALLLPSLPALRPGEARAFAAEIATPRGTMAASGTVTLASADPDVRRYRIALRTSGTPAFADASEIEVDAGSGLARRITTARDVVETNGRMRPFTRRETLLNPSR